MAHLKYNLEFKHWQISDLDVLLKAKSDSTITKNFGDISIIECLFPLLVRPFQDKDSKKMNLAIDLNDLIVGGIKRIYSENNIGVIGLWIDQDYRGRGLGTQAVKMFTNEMFRAYNLKSMHAEIFKENTSSIKIFQNAGYFASNNFVEDNKVVLKKPNIYYSSFETSR